MVAIGAEMTFHPTASDLLQLAGSPVRVLRQLSLAEAAEEVGPMFEVEIIAASALKQRYHAFADELTSID